MTPSDNSGGESGVGSSNPISSPEVNLSSSQSTEKLIPQSEVDKIVHARTRIAADKARQEVETRYQSQSMGGIPQMSESQIRDLVSKESEKKAQELYNTQVQQYQEQQAIQLARDFYTKMNNAKGKYQDYDQVFEGVDYRNYADIVQIASQFGEATPDIMYELFSHPNKLSNMVALASRDPMMAMRAMKEMKTSLSANASASDYKSPNEPLTHIKPSNTAVGSGDMNKMSISQLRKSSAFRA